VILTPSGSLFWQELEIIVDSAVYTLDTLNETLRAVHLLNSATGGLVSRGTIYGVLGFVQLWQGCYYMLVITKRRKEGIIGDHTIYGIEDTALVLY